MSCSVEVPPQSGDNRWIYQWHPKKASADGRLRQLDSGVKQEEVTAMLSTLSMRYQHQRVLALDSMLSLLSLYNDKRGQASGSGVAQTIASGAFLTRAWLCASICSASPG